MNSRYLVIIIAAIVIITGAYYFLGEKKSSEDRSSSQNQPSGQAAPTPTPTLTPPAENKEAKIIKMDADGFSPSNLTIKVGETVIFKNEDARDRWPASAMHPTHQVCPGFDSLKPVKTGETYSHTFTEAKECPFHDHIIPSLRGKITIEE